MEVPKIFHVSDLDHEKYVVLNCNDKLHGSSFNMENSMINGKKSKL